MRIMFQTDAKYGSNKQPKNVTHGKFGQLKYGRTEEPDVIQQRNGLESD